MTNVTITVEATNEQGEKQHMTFKYAHVEFIQERGIRKTIAHDGRTDIQPNGQGRFLLKAWSGCPSYDTFIKED